MKEKANKTNLTRKILKFFHGREAPLDELLAAQSGRTRSIYSLVHRLQAEGYLSKLKQREGRVLKSCFKTTAKGDEKLQRAAKPPRPLPKSWDGIWRLLVFDIPEEEKTTRERLRRELKNRGFYMLQLSVWLTPFEVDEDLEQFIEEIGAKDYVRYMVVKEINYEADIMRHFGF